MKPKPMTGTQSRILHTLADQLDTYDDNDARALAASLRCRLTAPALMSHTTARNLATNAALHLQELDHELRATKRREDARS